MPDEHAFEAFPRSFCAGSGTGNAGADGLIVESARIVIEIDGERALATLLAGPDVVSIKRSRQDAQPAKHPIILDIPSALKRAGTGMKLVVPGARNNAKCAPGLIRLLLRAFAIQDRLEQNPDLTLQRIAEVKGVSPSYVTRLLRLSYLALRRGVAASDVLVWSPILPQHD